MEILLFPNWFGKIFVLMVLKLIVLIIVSFYEMHDSKRDRRSLRTNEQKYWFDDDKENIKATKTNEDLDKLLNEHLKEAKKLFEEKSNKEEHVEDENLCSFSSKEINKLKKLKNFYKEKKTL